MTRKVFVTGGAGFIGSRLIKKMKAEGYGPFVVYDNLHPQVHGIGADFPDLGSDVLCVKAQIEDPLTLQKTIIEFDPDIIVHFVSETGTGQSLDELDRYVAANVTGTSNLLTAIGHLPPRARDFLLSSSRSIYGEGPYVDVDGKGSLPCARVPDVMRKGDFRVFNAEGAVLTPIPAGGYTQPIPSSVYASTKLMQEHLLLNCAEAKQLRPKILRFQNVYGPGQSLKNPYTGVLSIFAAQIMKGKTLNIFEDGQMIRDFVFVDDVVSACVAAISKEGTFQAPLNIGSGQPVSILQAASILIQELNGNSDNYEITGDFRIGDIRYAATDIKPTVEAINWSPKTGLNEGLARLAKWALAEFESNRAE